MGVEQAKTQLIEKARVASKVIRIFSYLWMQKELWNSKWTRTVYHLSGVDFDQEVAWYQDAITFWRELHVRKQ